MEEQTEEQTEEETEEETEEQTEEQTEGATFSDQKSVSDPIEARMQRLIGLGCDPQMAMLASTVGELYLASLLAADDVHKDKRVLELVGFVSVEKKFETAEAIMRQINVAFSQAQSQGGVLNPFDPRNKPSIDQFPRQRRPGGPR